MRLSARGDYAIRAAVEMAAAGEHFVKVAELAERQDIPDRFLENILLSLKSAGLVRSRRGAEGGYQLAKPADSISLADVIRATEGPLAAVQGVRPESLNPPGNAAALREVWIAVRANLRLVLEQVTLADVAAGELPGVVHELLVVDGAWDSH